jgi:hypothetical protein
LKLLDLVTRAGPLVAVVAAARLNQLIEHEAAERGFGAGQRCIDRPNHQGHVIGVAFPLERLIARLVRNGDEKHHAEQDERSEQPSGGSANATPVETVFLNLRVHERQL